MRVWTKHRIIQTFLSQMFIFFSRRAVIRPRFYELIRDIPRFALVAGLAADYSLNRGGGCLVYTSGGAISRPPRYCLAPANFPHEVQY